jgi:hypothetical protein
MLRDCKERLRRSEAVTIALGFQCFDGLVLCADRQLTKDDGLKYEQDKIWIGRSHNAGPSFVFTYSGSEPSARVLFNLLKRAIPSALSDSQKAIDVVTKVLESKHSKDIESLIGFPVPGSQPFLLRTQGKKVALRDTKYIGAGDSSVVRYLANVVLGTQFSCEQAKIVGSYFVWNATRYTDGCGGGPDVCTVEWSGNVIVESKEYAKWVTSKFVETDVQVGSKIRGELFSA